MNFFDKETYTEEDVLSLIENKIEENIHLDFKSAKALDKTPAKKKEIAKDVSAFANSAGGIIVYGMDEVEHVASNLSYVDGNEFNKEWLENLILDIQPRIPDVQVIPIRFKEDLPKSVYIVKIPESPNAPHMSKDGKYYKRYNFQSQQMEEYDVRSLYFKEQTPKLSIQHVGIGLTSSKNVLISMKVKNTSKILEKYFKIEIHIDNNIYKELCSNQNVQNVYSASLEGETMILSIKNQHPIFPFELLSVSCLNIDMESLTKYISINEHLEFKYKLHYSSASKVYEIDIKETVKDLIGEYAPMRQNQKECMKSMKSLY